jgi:hypothetical protein
VDGAIEAISEDVKVAIEETQVIESQGRTFLKWRH